ncbi:MAG: amidohydrolase [Chloroflexi bacterium]|nr:amidohydrolase [Chloroflexota bacterium]
MNPDLLIEHATVVTMNPDRDTLHDGSVAISGEKIAAVGPAEALRAQFPQAKRIDARGKVVLPGFINAHTHIAMSLQKGVTLAVPDGLYRVMWPVEKALTPEDVYIGALVGGAEALKGGATTVVDHYFYVEQTAKATTELGLRGVLGHTIMSRLGPMVGEKELEAGIDFVRTWKGRHPLVTPWLAPHASDTVAKEWLEKLRQVATEEGVGIHLHLAQSPQEKAYINEQYGVGCVEYLYNMGFLGKDVLAAHCIFIEDHELDLLAKSGTHPLYCPMTHSLGGHPARAWEMMQRGASVLIGTDCVTSNNVMDITGELRIAGAAQKQLTRDSEVMPSARLLEMVTVDAAAAIGMGDRLGSLIPGYLADLIVIDFDGLNTAPAYSLTDNLVYCCNGRDVNTVIVNGKVVVQDHKLLTADESKLVELIEDRGRKLIGKAVKDDADLAWLWRSSKRSEL